MSDDSPFPPDKRGKNPRSLANLIKSKPGDPSLNPKGNNGRSRAEYVAAFLDRADDTDLGKMLVKKVGLPEESSRIDALLQRDFIAGMGKSENARRLLIEQYAGRAAVKMDVTSSDGSLGPANAADAADRLNTEQRAHEVLALLAKAQAKPGPGPDGNPTT
jgi:hypothetical protein